MTAIRRHLASIIFALAVAAAVIVVAGYYENPSLLLSQVLFIAGPTAAPLLIAPSEGRFGRVSWAGIAALVSAGWAFVVYVDTRPYQGGGASFAILAGWFTCVVACLVAAVLRALRFRFSANR